MEIGIIGLGAIGKHHLNSLMNDKDVSKIHVYDPVFSDSQQPFHNVWIHSSARSVLNNINGVIIASPNHLHKDYILKALEKDIPILCEKPMCCSQTELNILKKSVRNPFLFNINFNYRFLKIAERARAFIIENEDKNIKSIKLVFYKDSAFRKKTLTWRETGQSGLSSGAFGDLGIHLIDMMQYLFHSCPEKNSLSLELKTRVKHKGSQKVMVDDDAHLVGHLENSVKFKIMTSKSYQFQKKGFGLTITSKTSSFHYHSAEPLYYKISTKDGMRQFYLENGIRSDPENEVYGWLDSISYVHKAWLTKIKTGQEDQKLATFFDAVRAQTVFCNAIDSYFKSTINERIA